MQIHPRRGGRDACPRCGGAVFEAERAATTSKGRPFHAKCLSCAACAKRLEPVTVCSGPGADPGTAEVDIFAMEQHRKISVEKIEFPWLDHVEN